MASLGDYIDSVSVRQIDKHLVGFSKIRKLLCQELGT
jgi:hypothetical protein